jgi:hypothetical protein
VQSKLSQVARIEDRVDTKLSLTAGLGAEVQELLSQSRSQDQGLLELRGELNLLQSHISKLEKVQAVAANEAAAASLTSVQRKQVREDDGAMLKGQSRLLQGVAVSSCCKQCCNELLQAVLK